MVRGLVGFALSARRPTAGVDGTAGNVGLGDAWTINRRAHALVGVTWDVPADISAVTRFVYAGRAGRAFPSWTTFNGWFVRGINIDEATSQSDIDLAADIGLEMFQLDAGWYPRKQPAHLFDFTDGLGSWQVDRDRFPSGLASLAEQRAAADSDST